MAKLFEMKKSERPVQMIILGVVLAVPFLFWGGPEPTSHPVYPAVWNLGHILLFGMLTLWLRIVFVPFRSNPGLRKLLFFSAVVFVVGVVIEWAQSGTSRDPNWHDIWRNQLGVCLAWFFLDRQGRFGRRLLIVGLLLLLGEFGLIGRVAWIERSIQNQLPVLSELEQDSELDRWTGNVSMSQEVAARGTSCLKVQLTTETYSGTGSKRMPRDWIGYELLAFEVYNPDPEPLRLVIRINDTIHDQQYTDRFNRSLTAEPGWNHFEITLADIENAPKTRKMDMKNIFNLLIFSVRLETARVIYLDYFRLE